MRGSQRLAACRISPLTQSTDSVDTTPAAATPSQSGYRFPPATGKNPHQVSRSGFTVDKGRSRGDEPSGTGHFRDHETLRANHFSHKTTTLHFRTITLLCFDVFFFKGFPQWFPFLRQKSIFSSLTSMTISTPEPLLWRREFYSHKNN